MTDVTPGDVLLGKYRVERVLGQGGMGVVVAARHIELDERVAIKFLLPELIKHAELMQRFLREARSAVKIRSEHVARVTDVGTMPDGTPYMVMEYLEGADLSAVVHTHGALSVVDAVDAVVQASDALAGAHALSIVHRDIKPANLFRTMRQDGSLCIKVLDFGISKIATPDEQALTRTRGIMGSPLYMSPEQLSSAKDVDARADIYALGGVLFELLTGHTPYLAEDLPRLVAKILNEPVPSVRAERSDVPPALDDIIRRCLAKDRAARIGSVGELCSALAPFASPANRVIADRVIRTSSPSLAAIAATAPPHNDLATSSPASFSATNIQPPVQPMPLALMFGVVLAVCGLGAFLVLRARVDFREPARPVVAAPAEKKFRVDVRVEPASAWVQLDDGEKVLGQLSRELVADGRTHTLRAGGDGLVPQTLTITDQAPAVIHLARVEAPTLAPIVKQPMMVKPLPPAAAAKPPPTTTEPAKGANGSKIIDG
jgi:serine/threonine protein kinase